MPTKNSRDLKSFTAQFDRKEQVYERAHAALAELRKQGMEAWAESREFHAMAKVGTKDAPLLLEMFAAHIVRVPSMNRGVAKVVWFADVKVAAKARASAASLS
jgi:hypothetical protein